MKKENIPFDTIIIVLSSVGFLVSIWLVYSNFKSPGFCPPVFSIPACYIVVLTFYLIIRSSFTRSQPSADAQFYTGSIIGLILAIWFSYKQIAGLENCPALFSIPLCFVSLLTFTTLLVCKYLSTQNHPTD